MEFYAFYYFQMKTLRISKNIRNFSYQFEYIIFSFILFNTDSLKKYNIIKLESNLRP